MMSLLSAALRHALRRQRRAWAATLLIVATLALALGANTAVLSVADALLARAVPFRDPGRLLTISSGFPSIRLAGMGLSGPEALELQQLTSVFSEVGPLVFNGVTVDGAAGAEQITAVTISAGAAAALDLTAAAGRGFIASDYSPGNDVALLGHALWVRAFGADPALVGKSVRIGGVPRTVIGVAPPGLTLFNRSVELWLPLALTATTSGGRADHRYSIIGRLAPHRSEADAAADLERAMKIWREETGELHTPSARMHPLEATGLIRATTGVSRGPIGALMAAVGFVMLIACANIASLLVTRGERRRAETALRLTLGASRVRLLADSMLEGLLLAAAGAAGGVLLARLAIDFIVATWPVAAAAAPALDMKVLGMTAAITAMVGVFIGLVPVLRLDLRNPGQVLSGVRGVTGGVVRLRTHRVLVAAQVALAVVLSGSAALMIRSLLALTAVDIGIDANGVTRAAVSLPAAAYQEDARVYDFFERLVQRLEAQPGVGRAAAMSGLPPQRTANNTSFLLDGVETVDHTSIKQVEFIQFVSPGYFDVLRIPLREGRALGAGDHERSAPAAVVNESLARAFWPGESAIGHRLKAAGQVRWFTVVGVVADVRQAGIQAPPGLEVYLPHRQARLLFSAAAPPTFMNVVARGGGDVTTMAGVLRDEVRRLDPAVPVSGVMPLQDIIDRSIAQPRLLAWMFGALSILALLTAGLGVFAVTSYAASSRTTEFGIRMALGAPPIDALRRVTSAGVPAIAGGIAAGAAGVIGGANLLRSLLFGVAPLDIMSLALGTGVMAAAAALAIVLPAVRAARIDPIATLRDSQGRTP